MEPHRARTGRSQLTSDDVITALGLLRHPEGGFYRETFRAPDSPRGASTSILFLLPAGEQSRWHRVDADEHWLFHDGDPMELLLADPVSGARTRIVLGSDILQGDVLQAVVPRGWWQAARPLGAWTLVGCVVAPAFEFAHFEMAPEGWEPGGA